MIGRRLPPVAAVITPGDLMRALGSSSASSVVSDLRDLLRSRFGASRALLTDSGTSALVLALRLVVPRGGVVALPAYSCFDVASAARLAGARVRLYDLDPATLSPDLDSVRRTLERGAHAIVVAHLFGFCADVIAVRRLAAEYGTQVIEDAAQGAGGTLLGEPLGSLGQLSVLSFGRGKGVSGGGGGALLIREPALDAAVEKLCLGIREAKFGLRELVVAAAQWLFGRPSLYGIPAGIPGLRLGQTLYRDAHEPAAVARTCASLVLSGLRKLDCVVRERQRRAQALLDSCTAAPLLRPISPIHGSVPGYLRLPILDGAGRSDLPALGVLRGYPTPLDALPELLPSLCGGEPWNAGAAELARSLFTLPTHWMMEPNEYARLAAWFSHTSNGVVDHIPNAGGRRLHKYERVTQ